MLFTARTYGMRCGRRTSSAARNRASGQPGRLPPGARSVRKSVSGGSELMSLNGQPDHDPQETREWLDALGSVLSAEGTDRAHFLLQRMIDEAHRSGTPLPFSATTDYVNTIPVEKQVKFPGDLAIEQRIHAYTRWNAMATVVRGNKHTNVGGHLSSFASAATLYEVGFNHFWHGQSWKNGGDLVFIQGHSSPGIYARAFLLGRFTEDQLDYFRQEVDGKVISSYPHPWLMPKFWQFPTVSMGLGPLMAIYQARFMRYLQDREILNTEGRKVWAFLGAGWNVIKVIWGRHWDPLLARDKSGILKRRMMEAVDGEYQTYKSRDGAYVREHFFNTPELKEMVADYSDEDIWNLNRGGHDPFKVYAAYHAAVNHKGQPTVILAKTIKGYQMGEEGEGMNIAHQIKKLSPEAIRKIRDRFNLPVPDDKLEEVPYLKFAEGSRELEYMRGRRQSLGGYLPSRRTHAEPLKVPDLSAFDRFLQSSEDREPSTTVVLVQILQMLARDKEIGKYVVPIVPDEARTFGMEGMFRQMGIWSHTGQKYTPQDAEQLMFYKEDRRGQFLEEGISEAGSMCDW